MMSNYHPRLDEHGRRITIRQPTTPSPEETWKDPAAVAVFVPDGAVPSVLNEVPVAPARHRSGPMEWAELVKSSSGATSPPLVSKHGKKLAAGAVILEPDGRMWMSQPTNAYGGYVRTFPKGTLEPGYSLEATAAKEVFEETGLLVEIEGFLVDCDRTLSVARFFLARRIGGSPSAMGWETQGVWLVPVALLPKYAPHPKDAPIVRAVLARE